MTKGFGRQAGGGDGMMQQIQRIQGHLAVTQAKLAEETGSATAGDGAVKVTMTGNQKCKAIEIPAALPQDADADMLQDLILAAVNLVPDQSRELEAQSLGPLTGGLVPRSIAPMKGRHDLGLPPASGDVSHASTRSHPEAHQRP